MKNKEIVNKVVAQMSEDFTDNYLEAVEEMLNILIEDKDNKKILLNYLPEHISEKFNK